MSGPEASGLRRVLGPVDATCVVIGAIVGVGIFFTPVKIAKMAGSEHLALLIWGLGGVVAMLGALTFAELGRVYPKAGGQYDILRDAYGPLPAFLYVFCNLTAIQAGAVAIITVICANNLGVLVGGKVPEGPWRHLAAHALIWGLTIANIIGVRLGATIQNLTVYAKVLMLAAVALIAAFSAGAGAAPAAAAPATASQSPWIIVLFAGLIPAMFSYGGWQQALWMGGEIRDAARVVPRAIIAGVLIVIGVYLSANWAFFHLLGYERVVRSEALGADAVGAVWPGVGDRIAALAVALSAFGVLNAQFLTGPRLTWAMARDGRFFRPFAGLSARTGTPWPAIALLGALASGLLVIVGPEADAIDQLTAWVVVIDALFFALTGFSLVVLWRRHPDVLRRSTVFLAVPVLFGLLELGAVYGSLQEQSVREASWFGLGWIVAAALCYGLFFRRPAR